MSDDVPCDDDAIDPIARRHWTIRSPRRTRRNSCPTPAARPPGTPPARPVCRDRDRAARPDCTARRAFPDPTAAARQRDSSDADGGCTSGDRTGTASRRCGDSIGQTGQFRRGFQGELGQGRVGQAGRFLGRRDDHLQARDDVHPVGDETALPVLLDQHAQPVDPLGCGDRSDIGL